MKKIFALILALLFVVGALAACGDSDSDSGSSTDSKSNSQTTDVDLTALLSSINTQYGISDLESIDSLERLCNVYKFDQDDVDSFAAELSTEFGEYIEVVIVKAKDSDAAGRIDDALSTYLDGRLNEATSYNKDALEMMKDREVHKSGNYVYMVLNDSAPEIEAMIANAIG